MAGAFDAKVDISTKQATDNLKALRKEVSGTSTMLVELDKALQATTGNLKSTADSLTKIVAAQRSAAAGSKELAQAKIAEARAAGIANVANAKAGELTARATNQTAQAGRATAQATLATTRAAESETRRGLATDRAAQATRRAAQSQLELHDNLSNSRYLMYDVGATYGVLAAGLMAIPAATAAVAAAYQRDFAQVIRVNEDLQGVQNAGAAQGLKDSLKAMATDMPIAFDELSRITQLGAQMGVATDKLAAFTDTTAKFVAVTGISADAGAQLFGRLETSFTEDVAQFPDFFERVGSSIAYVGAKTVATDPEIAAMLNQIGSLGAAAGMSAPQVTGLSAALASVRVQPELARGTLTRVFGQLNRDVAEGSPRMAEYGKVMGTTADQASKLWKSDPAKFFQDLIQGLNRVQTNGGELTTTFDDLGIKASRDVSALTKLAVGYDVLDKSMQAANEGFTEGTALNDMSKITFDTITAKLTEFVNAWKNLGDTLGGGALAPLAVFVDIAKNAAIGLESLIKHVPLVGVLISGLLGIAAVTAAFLGFKAAQAFVMAGMIGFQQAAGRGMGSGLALSNMTRTLAQTMLMAKGATEQQSRALLGQVSASRALLIANTTTSNQLRSGMAGSFGVLATSTGRATTGLRGFGSAALGMVGGPIGIAVAGLALLAGHLINTAVEAEQAGKAIADGLAQGADAGMRAVAKVLQETKVKIGDGIEVGNLDKSVTQIAEETGIGFDKLVAAVAKGKAGIQDFDQVLNDFARSKGYSSLQDMSEKNPIAIAGGDGATRAKMEFLKRTVDSLASSQEGSAKSTKVAEDALTSLGVPLEATGDGADETSTDIDKMTDALKALNDEVFGTINAEADLQDAMSKLGEGLQKSSQFSPNSEGGRANLKNLEDTLSKSRDYYKQAVTDQTMTAEQAAQGYSDFVTGLMNKIHSLGGDTSAVDALANNTKAKFQAAIGGAPVKIPVEADAAPAMTDAQQATSDLQNYIAGNNPKFAIGADTNDAYNRLFTLANSISEITGYPYEVVMDALTNPASEKAKEIYGLITSITNQTYTAPIGADTSAAITNVRNFATYARDQLSAVQTAYNNVAASAPTFAKYTTSFFKGAVAGKTASVVPRTPAASSASVPVIATPAQVAATGGMAKGLDAVSDGYNNAAKAAQGAGGAGKQAGKDMADGIDDAVAAADDYGDRLKTAMMSAYNQQYGLTKATDEYHSALNAIKKKRDDELEQLDELKTKVKELNNERNKELITANKAKIEAGISAKYGEVDRQADYENQAQTALDNADAKKKDIDATKSQAQTIQDGIGKLTGYSDAAIANREALRNLESKMIDMVSAYAATGKSQEQVRAYAQKLTAQFQKDASQIWKNRQTISNLVGDLNRYIRTVDAVPRTKTTTVNAATQNARNGIGGVQRALDALGDKDVTVRAVFKGHLEKTGNTIANGQPTYRVFRQDGSATNQILFNKGGQVPGFNSGGLIPGRAPSDPSVDNLMAQVDGKGMIRVRSREFIQPQEAVDHYGLDFMNAIRTLSLPKFNAGGSVSGGSSSASATSSGPTLVQLTAENIAAIQRAGDRQVVLYADARQIAQTANEGNEILAMTGAN